MTSRWVIAAAIGIAGVGLSAAWADDNLFDLQPNGDFVFKIQSLHVTNLHHSVYEAWVSCSILTADGVDLGHGTSRTYKPANGSVDDDGPVVVAVNFDQLNPQANLVNAKKWKCRLVFELNDSTNHWAVVTDENGAFTGKGGTPEQSGNLP